RRPHAPWLQAREPPRIAPRHKEENASLRSSCSEARASLRSGPIAVLRSDCNPRHDAGASADPPDRAWGLLGKAVASSRQTPFRPGGGSSRTCGPAPGPYYGSPPWLLAFWRKAVASRLTRAWPEFPDRHAAPSPPCGPDATIASASAKGGEESGRVSPSTVTHPTCRAGVPTTRA